MLDLLRLVLGLPVLAALLYVPGAVVLNSLARRHSSPPPFSGRDEWLFTAVLVSVLVTGGIGLVLAQVGLFRWWLLLALALLFSVAMAAALGHGPLRLRSLPRLLVPPAIHPDAAADARERRLQMVALVVMVAGAALLFSRPAEMLRGALDSGVYVNAGVAMARSGSILQRDVLMRQLNDDVGEGRELLQGLNPDRYTLDRLRMPGFYVLDKKAALVLPQHYSLYPVWIGLLYTLFGIWGALYATPLLALLAALAVYYFARRATTPVAALVALALLVLCPVTIWFSRYPVSEVPTALLAFGSFFAFLRMAQLQKSAGLNAKQNRQWAADGSRITHHASRNESAEIALMIDDSDLAQLGSQQLWACFWGAVAGVSLGELAFTRPDFIFYLAPVTLYLLYWWLARRWQHAHTWFAGSLLAMLGLYIVHLAFYGFAYTLDLYHNVIQNVRRLWGPLLLALYVGAILLILLDRLHPRLRPLWMRLERWAVRYRWAWAGVLVLLVGGYALYHYVLGPWLPNVRFDNAGRPIPQTIQTTWESYIGAPVDEGGRYNLLRLGWYLSPLGMLLGVAGLLRWIWGRLNAATGLFFGCLLVLSFVFIQETYTDAHYIYTMRRYLPVILPALILGIAWACQFLWSRLKPRAIGIAAGAGLAALIAVFFVYTARTIVQHIEERGAVAQLTELASRFDGRTVVLFSNERDEPNVVATPLQYVFGIDSFVVNRAYPNVNNQVLEGVVRRWQEQGYKVWVMMSNNGGKLHFPNLSLREEGSWAYDVPEFEQLRDQKPFNVSRAYLPWGIYSVQPRSAPPPLPFRLDIGEMDYKWTVAGFHWQERAPWEPSAWRWTGEHAVLRLPIATDDEGKTLEAVSIELTMRPETPIGDQPVRRTQPLTVTLSLGDTPIGEVTMPPGTGFQAYSLRVPAGTQATQGPSDTALLNIEAPTWSPASAGVSKDRRALGVQVDAVEVSR